MPAANHVHAELVSRTRSDLTEEEFGHLLASITQHPDPKPPTAWPAAAHERGEAVAFVYARTGLLAIRLEHDLGNAPGRVGTLWRLAIDAGIQDLRTITLDGSVSTPEMYAVSDQGAA